MAHVNRVALVGSTASGKSAVSMEVARTLGDVELVSVDSMQVYRGMDIGTAKPTVADQADVAHHCIDLVEATEQFTVGDFKAAHDEALAAISASAVTTNSPFIPGRALLVGGTGLYHRVVVDDFDLPGEFPDVRAELDADPDTSAQYSRLREIDPAAAGKIEPENRRRVHRALEVTIGAGRPFSSFGPGVDAYPPTPVVQIGLRRPREVVTERIRQRVHAMIDAGLVEEVERLLAVGFSRSAGQALGYKEIVAHLRGEMSKDEAIDTIIVRTRQFAVRQERWFRRDPRVRWIDVESDPVAEVAPAVIRAFDEPTA